MRTFRFALLSLLVLIVVAPPALARVLLKPSGGDSMPLCTRSMAADVTIDGQFASTTMNLVFQNESSDQMEAEFVYELPAGAVATYFAYWAGEEKVVAKIVEKEQAKQIYERVTTYYNRDPALVEMIGKNTFRAKVFPVMPNADLKVEIHIVHVLPADSSGVTYSLPIYDKKQLDPLDSISVKIHVQPDPAIQTVSSNYGIPVQHGPTGYTIDLTGKRFRPRKDLSVHVTRKPERMHASLSSACLGANDGYFALALTPDHTMTNAQVTIEGVKTSDVTSLRFPRVNAFQPVIIFGRYQGSGKAIIRLTGKASGIALNYSAPVKFESAITADNLPGKLWAAARIRQLSPVKSNRAAVMSLSNRFGLPSKYTSWLAMPKAEMQMYARDHYSAQLNAALDPLRSAVREGKADSAVAPLMKSYTDLCTRIGLDPNEELNDGLKYDLISDLTDMVAAGKEESAEAKLLSSRITSILGLNVDWSAEAFQGAAGDAMRELADKLVRAQDQYDPDSASIDALKTQMARIGRLAGFSVDKTILNATQNYRLNRPWELIRSTVQRIKDGKPVKLPNEAALLLQGKSDNLAEQIKWEADSLASTIVAGEYHNGENGFEIGNHRTELDRLCKYAGLDAAAILRKQREDKLVDACKRILATRAGKPNQKQMEIALAGQARLEKLLGHSSEAAMKVAEAEYADDRAREERWAAGSNLFDTMAKTSANRTQIAAARQRLIAACAKLGLNAAKEMNKTLSNNISGLAWDLVEAESQPQPDLKQVAQLRSRLKLVQHRSGISLYNAQFVSERPSLWYALDPIHSLLQGELERNDPNKTRLMRLVTKYKQLVSSPEVKAGGQWRKDQNADTPYDAHLYAALDLYLQSTTLAKKADAARSQGHEAKAAELEARRQELHAVIGGHVGEMTYLARWGDPLITVDAPADAQQVIAIMPDGEIKILAFNVGTSRWEARFDIPSYASEGDYPIQVVVVLHDGTRKELTLHYTVDLTPPTGTVVATIGQGSQLRMDVAASADTARISALLPWGERVEMRTSSEPGKFYAIVPIPAENGGASIRVQCVLTDRAHNRSTIAADARPQ